VSDVLTRALPAQLKAYLAAEVKAWGDVVRSVGLKID
jgi:tripartite-type tricarboxylate transporter receptor subunit TctC